MRQGLARHRRPTTFAGVILKCAAWLAGSILASFAGEKFAAGQIEKHRGLRLLGHDGFVQVGRDVAEASRIAAAPGAAVHTAVLGDSVCRQMFRPGKSGIPSARFVPSNYGIAMAGQLYLLDEMLVACPGLRRVYFVCFPGTLANDLRSPIIPNYLCAFFHKPRQVVEVFGQSRDLSLLASHVGRMVWPNLVTLNAAMQQATPDMDRFTFPPSAAAGAVASDGAAAAATTSLPGGTPFGAYRQLSEERDVPLDFVSDCLGRPPPFTWSVDPSGDPRLQPIRLSQTSTYFLREMRARCASRGMEFHLLCVPISQSQTFHDDQRLFENDLTPLPADWFVDNIHFVPDRIETARQRLLTGSEIGRRLAADVGVAAAP